MILPALALGLLTQLPPNHPPVQQELPPNHPQLGVKQGDSQQELPPNHPPFGNPQQTGNSQLPDNHPQLGNQQQGSAMQQGGAAPSVDELIKQLDQQPDLKTRQKSFEVAAGIGKLYYAAARRPDAAEYLRQALTSAADARKTYLDLRKKAGKSALPACEESPKTLADAVTRARELSKSNLPLAVSCLGNAVQPVIEAQALLASSLFLSGDAEGALTQYRGVLELSEGDEEALFGEGLLLLEEKGDSDKALAQAKQDFDRYLLLHPAGPRVDHARALLARVHAAQNAGGLSKLKPEPRPQLPPQSNLPPPLSREQMEAAQNAANTPGMEQALSRVMDEAEDHLAHGRFQQALDSYKQVMPAMPSSGRAQAGMAWSLIGLNKQPMADRVWGVAVGNAPDAIDALGETLKKKGDEAGAKKLWAKLKESAPDYAAKAGLEKKL